MQLLGFDKDGNFYWDGKPVEVRRTFSLTRWQKVGAFIVAAAAIAGGIGGLVQGIAAGHDLGCKLHWFHHACS